MEDGPEFRSPWRVDVRDGAGVAFEREADTAGLECGNKPLVIHVNGYLDSPAVEASFAWAEIVDDDI